MVYSIGATSTDNNQNSSVLEDIVNHINITIKDDTFIGEHKDGDTSFNRDRVFTFKVLLCFMITNLQKGLQREIFLFKDAIEQDGGSIVEVDKSAFSKARKKLKPTVFTALSDIACEKFYESNEAQTWHGYRVLGIDGSTVELPNNKEILEKYGVFKTRDDGKTTSMARISMIYDVQNQLTVNGSLDLITESETSMLMKSIPNVQINKNDLFVFDRLYASHLLFFYLQHIRVQFCFRMKNNWWKVIEKFNNSKKENDVITLILPIKDEIEAKKLGITATKLRCRLTRIELESGEIEILLTTLTNEEVFSVADIKELYGLRWGIEENYKTFKHKVCIENFSGKLQKSVLQDFYAKIFIMNLTAIAVRPINEALKKKTVKVKYTHQVNMIEAIAAMKKTVVSLFVTNKINKAIKKLKDKLFKTTEPIRPGRKFERNHQPKRKYYMNYKPV